MVLVNGQTTIFVVFSHLNDSVVLWFFVSMSWGQIFTEWELPYSHPLFFSSSQSCTALSSPAFPRSLLPLHKNCTAQSRRERWWNKSKLSVELNNKTCMNLEPKFLFCWTPGAGKRLNSPAWFLLLLGEPEMSTHTKSKIVRTRCWDIFGCNHGSGHSA